MNRKNKQKHHVVCINNQGYEASLEKRKIYRAILDSQASDRGLIRVYDESGQAYFYPSRLFVAVKLPQPVLRALSLAA